VLELNRAVAVAMRDWPEAGLALIYAILVRGDLADYQLAHAARGRSLPPLGTRSRGEGLARARLTLTRQEPERPFLERRLGEVAKVGPRSAGGDPVQSTQSLTPGRRPLVSHETGDRRPRVLGVGSPDRTQTPR
jgi:hypothetical protein